MEGGFWRPVISSPPNQLFEPKEIKLKKKNFLSLYFPPIKYTILFFFKPN